MAGGRKRHRLGEFLWSALGDPTGGFLPWRPASGGPARQLTTLDSGKQELLHAWPSVIAQGRVLLFASITGSSRGASHIEALSLPAGQRRVIVESGTFPQYAPSGHLVFFRDGALLGAPFDIDRLEVTGPVVRVLENLAVGTTMDAPLAMLSATTAAVPSSRSSIGRPPSTFPMVLFREGPIRTG